MSVFGLTLLSLLIRGITTQKQIRRVEGTRVDIENITLTESPVILVGAASKWDIVGRSIDDLIVEFPSEQFYFDVAPLERPQTNQFSFVPYYNGHGYQFDDDICSQLAQVLSLRRNKSKLLETVNQTCFGTQHVHELKQLDFLRNETPARDVLFTKLSPRNIPISLQNKFKPDDSFILPKYRNKERDFDLWVGTEGWTSATHYDLQNNCYIQLIGRKHFVLSPPFRIPQDAFRKVPLPVGGGVFSHLHARHRQTFNLVAAHDPSSLVGVLEPGDVLYIPAFWLHTATALSTSASLALCSTSKAEELAWELESLPLPLEMEWSSERKGKILKTYFDQITRLAFDVSITHFAKHLIQTRYRGIFNQSKIDEYEITDMMREDESSVIIQMKTFLQLFDPSLYTQSQEKFFHCFDIHCKAPSNICKKNDLEESVLSPKLQNRALLIKDLLNEITDISVRWLLVQNFIEQVIGFIFGGYGALFYLSHFLVTDTAI